MKHLLSNESKGPVGLIVSVIVLIVVFSFLNPRFASVENLQNVLFQSSVPLIIVVGATLVIIMGSIDLSVQGVMGAAGMAWILITPNTRTELGYGVGIMLYGNGLLPSLTNETLARWPTRLSLGIPNSFWLAAAVLLLGVLIMNYPRFGRGLLAIGNNEIIARSSGIRVSRYKILALSIAGGLSALAGILATMQLGSGSSDIGSTQLFTVIPAAVIGGTALSGGEGGIMRSALGVFLLIILNNGLVLAGVSPNYQQGVFGLILIIAVVTVAWPHRSRLKVAK